VLDQQEVHPKAKVNRLAQEYGLREFMLDVACRHPATILAPKAAFPGRLALSTWRGSAGIDHRQSRTTRRSGCTPAEPYLPSQLSLHQEKVWKKFAPSR
jgi:hypothetical protein